MPGTLWWAIIVALAAIVALIVSRSFRKKAKALEAESVSQKEAAQERSGRRSGSYEDYDYGHGSSSTRRNRDADFLAIAVPVSKWVTVALFALAGLLFGLASTTIVSTKNVGVVTEFGRPVGTLDNGFHVVAPWQKVTELDGAIQTDSHAGNGKDDTSPCTSVRIAHQSVACVDNSIRWRIKQGAADRLFRDYKDFANIRDSLVTRELGSALNTTFKDYDPLATDDKGNTTSPSQDFLSAQVTKLLQAQIGEDIEVLNVIVPIVHFDDQTQGRINALQAEVANTRIAKQRQQTADAEAEANRKLADSVSKDPNVLVSKCFDTLAEMVKQKQPVPPGYSCWPGSQSALVVPSTK
jgi:regulator of protease activity HflC (stomatin/prohibitin superfamily)